MEDRETLTEKQQDELLERLGMIKVGLYTAIVMLVAVIANLALGNWQSLALTIGVIAGLVGLWTLAEGREGPRESLVRYLANKPRVGGVNTLNLMTVVILTIVAFLIEGLAHVLWGTDHLVRMVQLYLGIAAISLLLIGGIVVEKIETKLKQDQSFAAILNRYRE